MHVQTASLTSRLEKNLCVFSSQLFILFDVSVTLLFVILLLQKKKKNLCNGGKTVNSLPSESSHCCRTTDTRNTVSDKCL